LILDDKKDVIVGSEELLNESTKLSQDKPIDTIISDNTLPSLSSSTTTLDLVDIIQILKEEGIICDSRKPNVIRIAPTPLYNSFSDVYTFVHVLKRALKKHISCVDENYNSSPRPRTFSY
jgi:selenocysteine lyase/cysteine desulfurase